MHQNKSLPGEEACLLWGGFSVLKNESCFVLFLVVLWLEVVQAAPPTHSHWGPGGFFFF